MKFHTHTLSNGLRSILIPSRDSESVMVMVLVGVGSDFEEKKENGLSHFLEHMCFKGTTNRPHAKDIAIEFDSIGAQNNAFTNTQYTGYYARAHKKHTAHIMEMISDIYLNSIFPEEEIKKEQGVVIQEINMYNDDPQYQVSKLSTEVLYGDQPSGRDIAGTKENVASFTRKDIIEYHKKHYSAKNTLVIVAGNIDQKKITKQITQLYGNMKTGKKSKRAKTVVSQKALTVAVQHKATDQTHLILSFRMAGYLDTHNVVAATMSQALGSGMSSRLFQKMREELGICYYAYAMCDTKPDAGVLSIYAGVANDRVEEALQGIIDVVRQFRDEGVNQKELEKVTEGRLSSLVLNLETPVDFAYLYGKDQLLKGKIHTPSEYAKKIESVTVAEVNKMAKAIFKTDKATLAMVGPFNKAHEDTFAKLIKAL